MLERTRCALLVLALITAVAAAAAPPASGEAPLRGFSDAGAAEQRALEARFDSYLNASNLRNWMQRLSARPHHVGSPYGKQNAEFMADLLRSW